MATLLVTVAVESDMPKGEVQARTTLESLKVLPKFHALCRARGVRPTYLVTWPVAQAPEAEVLVKAQADGEAEIGALLLPWTTPPFQPDEDRLRVVAPSSLPTSALEAKLARLTDAVEQRFGQRPRSFRAARFGCNGAALQALERLGYTVDSSATPFVDWRGRGGPDWVDAPESPYFPDRQQPARRGASPVLEVPVSVGWDRTVPSPLGRLLARTRQPKIPRSETALPGPSLVPRLLWLYPAAMTAADMCRLADVLVDRGLPSLNLIVRSTDLYPGASSMCRSEDEAARALDRFDRFVAYALSTLGAAPRTLTGFAAHYLNED